jgi:hypothetical protein
MEKIISRRYRILISLVTLLISGVPTHASSQGPFPSEAYPRDVAYVYHLLAHMAEDPRFNNSEKTPDAELNKQIGSRDNLVTDPLISNQGFIDDQEPYDYWPTVSANVVADN